MILTPKEIEARFHNINFSMASLVEYAKQTAGKGSFEERNLENLEDAIRLKINRFKDQLLKEAE